MSSHREVRTISRPAAEVYAFLVDLDNFAGWVPGISGFTPPQKPIARGDTTQFKVNGLGMQCTYDTLDPAGQLTYDIDNLFGRIHVEIDLEASDPETTRMTKTHTVRPSWIGRLLSPMVNRVGARQLRGEVDLIKQHLEQ